MSLNIPTEHAKPSRITMKTMKTKNPFGFSTLFLNELRFSVRQVIQGELPFRAHKSCKVINFGFSPDCFEATFNACKGRRRQGRTAGENPSQQFLLPGLCSRSWPKLFFCPSCLLTFWRSWPRVESSSRRTSDDFSKNKRLSTRRKNFHGELQKRQMDTFQYKNLKVLFILYWTSIVLKVRKIQLSMLLSTIALCNCFLVLPCM